MARTYKRDSRGRFSGSGGGGGGGKSRPAPRQVQRGVNRLTRDNAGRITSVGGSGATARGGRIRTAAGNLRATVTSKAGMVSQGRLTGAPLKSTIGKTSKARLNMGLTRPGKPGQREAYNAARTQLRANKATSTSTRKAQLAKGAQRNNAKADRIDAKVKALEAQYRSKDAAFYTQGVKPAGRDRMIAKSQQAAQLREQSAALRTKAANAEKMSQETKGTAASKKQERRNAFDAAGYKVGDTVTTAQYGTQKITKISKNSVSFDKGNSQDKAFMANYLQLQAKPEPAAAKPAATRGARLGGTRRTTRAASPRNTTPNRTGQSKTLNKFNSRPVGTKILNAKNQLVASTTRVPLRVAGPGSRESDRAFARVATKTTRLRAVNKRMGDRPDLAQVNIKGRFSGQAGKRMDASIDRAVKQVKAAEQARLMKPKAQVKAERAAKAEANRQAAAAKPKRIRSAESLRTSRAKQIEKRRSITTNPAGERASAAAKMAANATRTQQRATAFYKANASKKRR